MTSIDIHSVFWYKKDFSRIPKLLLHLILWTENRWISLRQITCILVNAQLTKILEYSFRLKKPSKVQCSFRRNGRENAKTGHIWPTQKSASTWQKKVKTGSRVWKPKSFEWINVPKWLKSSKGRILHFRQWITVDTVSDINICDKSFQKWSINVKIDTFEIANGALKKWKINRWEHLGPQIPVLRWTDHIKFG